MATSEPKAGERVKDVRFSEDSISVDLVDGRTITAPLAWYPRLLRATVGQRANWRIAGGSRLSRPLACTSMKGKT